MVCLQFWNHRGKLRPHWPGGVLGWDMSPCDCCANMLLVELPSRYIGMETCRGAMEKGRCGSWGNEERGFVIRILVSWCGERGAVVMPIVAKSSWWSGSRCRSLFVVVRRVVIRWYSERGVVMVKGESLLLLGMGVVVVCRCCLCVPDSPGGVSRFICDIHNTGLLSYLLLV